MADKKPSKLPTAQRIKWPAHAKHVEMNISGNNLQVAKSGLAAANMPKQSPNPKKMMQHSRVSSKIDSFVSKTFKPVIK